MKSRGLLGGMAGVLAFVGSAARFLLLPGGEKDGQKAARGRVAGGAVQQGDHVSVYGSLQPLNGKQDTTTVELVPDALVLKVDAPQAGGSTLASHSGGSNETLVTLALTADQAEKLMFSQEFGHVWLTLLPPGQPGTQVPPVT